MPTSAKLRMRITPMLLMLALGCATASPTLDHSSRPTGAILHATNKSLDDLELSILRGGLVIPIGKVPAFSQRAFVIAGSQLGPGGQMQIQAGTRLNPQLRRSPVFTVSVGQRIDVLVDQHSLPGVTVR